MSHPIPSQPMSSWREAERQLREVSSFVRLLWYCAGVDQHLLMRCPSSDRIKYMGIGGTVLITTLLAFISGSHTFQIIFGPKYITSIGNVETDWGVSLSALCFGVIWSLIVLNIDRLIVSSTGHDEQDGQISLRDIVHALPRIFLGIMVGLSVSTPLELSIMNREIDAHMSRVQQRQVDQYDLATKAQYQRKEDELKEKVSQLEKSIEDIEFKVYDQKLKIKDEAERQLKNPSCSTNAGCLNAVRTMKVTKLKEHQVFKKKMDAQILLMKHEKEGLEGELKVIDQRLEVEHKVNLLTAKNMNGLLMRIQIAHEIGGYLPWLIMMLLLSLELSPIFFKMYMTKSAYDYFKENQHRQALADNGIQCMKDRFVDDHIEQVESYYHLPLSILHQEKQRQIEERRWNSEIIDEDLRKQLNLLRFDVPLNSGEH